MFYTSFLAFSEDLIHLSFMGEHLGYNWLYLDLESLLTNWRPDAI